MVIYLLKQKFIEFSFQHPCLKVKKYLIADYIYHIKQFKTIIRYNFIQTHSFYF